MSDSPQITAGNVAATFLALAVTYGLMRATLSINPRMNPAPGISRGPAFHTGPVTGTLRLTARETAAYQSGDKARLLERALRSAVRRGGDVNILASDGRLLGIAHSLRPVR